MGIRKSILPIVFSMILLTSTTQAVYGGPPTICNSIATGEWDISTTWDNSPDGTCHVMINNGHTVTITDIVGYPASITVKEGGALVVDGPSGGNLTIKSTGDGTNNGMMTMIGSDGSFQMGSLRNQGSFANTCFGIMVFNGGDATNSGSFFNDGPNNIPAAATAVNSGIMTFNGGDGTRSGSLNNDLGIFTNHNTLNFNAGSGSQAGVLIGQVTEDPRSCTLVAGSLTPIDTTMVLVAGAQSISAWMIPVIVAGIGFAIVIARKF